MAQERGAEILAPASLETQFDQKQALKDKILLDISYNPVHR